MTESFRKTGIKPSFCLLLLCCCLCSAGEKRDKDVNQAAGLWDPARYISVDEIQPGMKAYCLTVYKGTQAERFDLEVLSVVRNYMPKRDAILVQGTDERFVHTGPVAGCSGSPVYIEGRLAGALAFGWFFSKDPLYGVTPIKEMLEVGRSTATGKDGGTSGKTSGGYSFDYSKPIDFAQVEKQIAGELASANRSSAAGALPCPLIASGLPATVSSELGDSLRPFGIEVISGMSGGAAAGSAKEQRLTPGACLAVPLVTGDISMEVIGTVTEVRGDDVFGFGHSFLGYGLVDLPMATGQVHTVVSSMFRSFKFATAGEIVGALTMDESAAVRGRVGATPKMIPLTVTVERYNDPQKRRYECRIAGNRLLTPILLRGALAGAVLMQGPLPPDHTIEYIATVKLDGEKPVAFANVSANTGLMEMVRDSIGSVAMLLNNPYKEIDIQSIDFNVKVGSKNLTSGIWSVDISDPEVKAGEQIDVDVVTESFLAEKKKYKFSLVVPKDIQPGQYELIVCGGYDYEQFVRKAVPYRFVPTNLSTLVESMNEILAISRDGLHCVLVLPPSGIAVERAELPDLPATKSLVLGHAKRDLVVQPYQHWIEKAVRTGTVVMDGKQMQVTVTE